MSNDADAIRPDQRPFKQIMNEVEVLMDEYEDAIAAYAAWMDGYRARQQKQWPRSKPQPEAAE